MKYKSGLFMLLCILPLLDIHGQITKELNMPRDNDVIVKRQIDAASIREMDNGTIDLTGVEDVRKGYTVTYRTAGEDSVSGTEHRTKYLYALRGDSLLTVGTRSQRLTIAFDRPECTMTLPMNDGDETAGVYHGMGTYCDRMFVRCFGSYKTMMTKSGRMILPDGRAIGDVYMIKTEKTVCGTHERLDSMIAIYGETGAIPHITEDSIIRHAGNDTSRMRTVTKRWYAKGYRYPLLETIKTGKDTGSGETLMTAAFYYPPEEQELLEYDAGNETARAERRARDRSDDSDGTDRNRPYRISQNDGSRTVTVWYDLTEPETINAMICNTAGMVYRQEQRTSEAGAGQSLSVYYGGLKSGQYVMYINIGGERYSEKITVK